MIEFRRGKSLWAGVAVIILTALVALYNVESFSPDGIPDTFAIIRFLALFTAMSGILTVRIRLPKVYSGLASAAIFLLCPWISLETVMLIIGVQKYADSIYLYNLCIYAFFQLLFFLVTQSTRFSVCLTVGLATVLNFANEIVLLIRGTPIVPTDLYAISTAMKVTTASDWHFNSDMLTGLVTCIFFVALAMNFKLEYPKKWLRPCVAAVTAAVFAVAAVGIYNIDYESFSTSTFDTESTNNVNGTALNFYINLRKMKFEQPEGYSAQKLNDYLSKYDEPSAPENADYPNIIVIMNESFSDLSYLGRLRTTEPYMKYFNSLTYDYPSGRNLVSVLGGGTCNTEFEFLTGLSMMYMPSGCYAYMQHITGPVDSMASYLNKFGYKTVAMHPFYEICWKRNSVYKFMGFDDFISGEDMAAGEAGLYVSADRWEKGFGDNVEYIRTLISDSFFYKEVINQFENKGDDPLFVFGVTVQNHSTYEYDGDDFVADVHIKSPEGDFPRAEQYLSLIKDSDEALEELISYFENVDEKTIIVFFGDHQPNVEAELIDALAPQRELFVNSYLTRFETPYVIWSNYDTGLESSYYNVTSANFLGLKTLEAAGIPLSKEYQLIKEAEGIAPAMSTWGYYDRFSVFNEREDTYADEVLNIYNYYTYYQLKGKRGSGG